jgi:hypothetical protein
MKHFGSLILLVVMLLSHAGRAQVIESIVGGKKRTVTYGIVHYAGSIGFLSAGIGLMNSRQTRSIEFLVGYLPESIGGQNIVTVNWRIGAATRTYPLGKYMSVQPLNINLGVSYSPQCDYDLNRPAVFPEGYYWWSEALRVNLNVGSTLVLNRTLSLYYEIGTNELKLVSYALNTNSLSVLDMMHLGIGMRFKM